MMRQSVSTTLRVLNAFRLPLTNEAELVTKFAQDVIASAVVDNPHDVIDFYVALKSRPLALLAGPALQGKADFVQCLARFFVGDDYNRCQMMLGHPWWAGESDHVVFFTKAQNLFTFQKLHYLIEEAWRPENRQHLFIGCMAHISPGELISIFTSLSQQISEGGAAKLDPSSFRLELPWPPNLLLIGTMDTKKYDWWDAELVSKTSVFLWELGSASHTLYPMAKQPVPGLEEVFIHSAIRDEAQAYQKVQAILNWHGVNSSTSPLKVLLDIIDKLERFGAVNSRNSLREAVIYLANAWSMEGVGLFDPLEMSNLILALDRAILRIVLPQAYGQLARVKALREELAFLLHKDYPLSTQFLHAIV